MPPFRAGPLLAAVDGEVDAELGADEQQFGLHVILHETPHDLALGQVRR